jgi:hypothetical protein
MPRRCQSSPRVYRNGLCHYCGRIIKVTEWGYLWGHKTGLRLVPGRWIVITKCKGSWTPSWTLASPALRW